MKSLIISRGVYRLSHTNAAGEKSPSGFEDDPTGGCIVIADIEDNEGVTIEADNGALFSVWQRHALANLIAERLNLPAAEDLPDIRKIAKAMKAYDIDICEYCCSMACRECELNGHYEEDGEDE